MLNSILLFLNLGTGEIILIAFVVLLLFGAKKIPELMKGMGKGVRSFKEGMNEVKDEINKATPEEDLERLNREKEERRKAQDGQ
ncbi:MAG: twin-arginine translocase TatA/TatE family subunit [Bacteroidales bacterium]|nr:twin-arginine translocase TatA/TatE family subunit [Candidatus Sodaliphilus aphodohippi]